MEDGSRETCPAVPRFRRHPRITVSWVMKVNKRNVLSHDSSDSSLTRKYVALSEIPICGAYLAQRSPEMTAAMDYVKEHDMELNYMQLVGLITWDTRNWTYDVDLGSRNYCRHNQSSRDKHCTRELESGS